MEITVAGTARTSLQPEEGVLPLQVSNEHADAAEALGATTRTVNALTARLDELKAQGAVTRVVVKAIQTWSYQEWEKSRRASLRFVASCSIEATFTDLVALSTFVGAQAQQPDVQVQEVRWRLTDETRRRVEAEVLAEAVGRARERAVVIADGQVELVEAADPGLLRGQNGGTGSGDSPRMGMMSMRSGGGDDGAGVIELRPDDVVVETTVHARFATR